MGLGTKFWGKGYASEASREVQRAGLDYLVDIPLISLIHPDNKPSIALALAAGAVLEKTVKFRGGQWHLYRHPAKSPPSTNV